MDPKAWALIRRLEEPTGSSASPHASRSEGSAGEAQPHAVGGLPIHPVAEPGSLGPLQSVLQLLVTPLIFMYGHKRHNGKTRSWKIMK